MGGVKAMTFEWHVVLHKEILATAMLVELWKCLILSLGISVYLMETSWIKKLLTDRNRKSTKNFKYRRNQLHGQKSKQTAHKEAQEGTTYETAVGLNLDTSINQPVPPAHTQIEHLLENISENEFRQYKQIVPPYSAQPDPVKLSFDPTKTYTFVFFFDTETTCTEKNAELCQLSAIDENSLLFSKYILPTGSVSPGATRVNKLSVENINGTRRLFKEKNQPVETASRNEVLREFVAFLDQVETSSPQRIFYSPNRPQFLDI